MGGYRDWEIYCTGDVADDDVFGYQERWAEYRYHPALITGRFRSTAASTLDSWHLAQKFSSRPLLNNAFINEDPPIARVSAVNTAYDLFEADDIPFILPCEVEDASEYIRDNGSLMVENKDWLIGKKIEQSNRLKMREKPRVDLPDVKCRFLQLAPQENAVS